ncbi:MAG: S41 family peptidase [Candidatus Omnitrophica bacterium]|nr:S41 family peptidase [Candidatus Omnitrophota bacterium]
MRKVITVVGMVLGVTVLLVQDGLGFGPRVRDDDNFYQEIELFADALSTIEQDYVDEITAKDLIYGALKGMLSSLDSHSQFMDPETYKEIKVETEGAFGGLGIEISIRDSLLTIISPIYGTPAYEAGLKAGDRIVKIEDEITRDITLLDAVKKLRGKPGSKVKLTVLREGESELLDFTIVRDIVKIESIREPHMLTKNIGYVRINEFQEKTSEDLEAALATLTERGADSLILDLRNNPGGLLDVAVEVSEQFLEKNQLIVSTDGRRANQDMEFRARGRGRKYRWPVVVMVNEGSASGSEIVAGAIQDNKRGLVVGTKSFGKGSVQTIIPLRDGSALRLTTSKYYTPSGVCIHGEGIHPDIVVEMTPPPEEATEEETPSEGQKVFEEIVIEEGIEPPEAEEYAWDEEATAKELARDTQLARAVDILQGIRVYKSFGQNAE